MVPRNEVKKKSNRKERKGRINVGAGFKPAHFRVVRIIMVESFLHLRQFFWRPSGIGMKQIFRHKEREGHEVREGNHRGLSLQSEKSRPELFVRFAFFAVKYLRNTGCGFASLGSSW